MASHAHILCPPPGTGEEECRIQHIRLPTDVPQPPDGKWPSIDGLNKLQSARDAQAHDVSIDKALEAYHFSLPPQVRDMIHLGAADDRIFRKNDVEYKRLMASSTSADQAVFDNFKSTEYTVWPVFYILRGVLVVIRKENPGKAANGYTRIVQFAILDSHGTRDKRIETLEQKLRPLLTHFGFTFADEARRTAWVPIQETGGSNASRVFWAARQMIDRILNMVVNGWDYYEGIWEDLSGWYNDDFVRWEMIGLNAYQCVREMDYRARIAVELVNDIRQDDGTTVDAGDTMRPPAERKEKMQQPPNRKKPTTQNGKSSPSPTGSDKKEDEKEDVKGEAQKTSFWKPPNNRQVAPEYSLKQGHYRKRDRQGDAPTQSVFSRTHDGTKRPREASGFDPVHPGDGYPPDPLNDPDTYVPAGKRRLFS
ncbi:hypothetical protein F4819DRAFT_468730 [Hypoxylon fuscum]|nr:hypothetical protein F4819DRAFT_468730 [Hypoxylon fuscum]